MPATDQTWMPASGRCGCGHVHYQLLRAPLYVHCCHCTWCQRETGSAFAVNAMIESEAVHVDGPAPEVIATPSASGAGQRISRCPVCRVAVWSNYGGAQDIFRFVRVGTLDEPARCPPDMHIFTSTRAPWFTLPEGVPAVPEYYRRSAYWPAASIQRRQAALDRADGLDTGA